MAARPLVTVQPYLEKPVPDPVRLPSVFLAPIRPDIVLFVHTNMAKNHRQPYAVKPGAGHQHSAESWGTGRAVARIPRVSGGGTHRAGQAAFGNMCRKGRLAAPTKIWRKWHRKINLNQKRYAVVSALAASALPALVMARGHRVDSLPEIPLVVDDEIEACSTVKKALDVFKSLGLENELEKVRESRKIRQGKGKMRNRRYVQRRGPLVVYNEDRGVGRAVRNIPGVETCEVSRLNLLQLAPGGHVGRLIVWSQSAFKRLDSIYGTERSLSKEKSNYRLPRPLLQNTDVTRVINSDEIQSVVRPAEPPSVPAPRKRNPLTHSDVMQTLNPAHQKQVNREVQKRKRAAAGEASKKKQKVEESA
jgi:large subunit ribosomal protein L4e